MVGNVVPKVSWNETFAVLSPNSVFVSEWNRLATNLKNDELKSKIFKVSVARNCVYASLTGLIVGVIGTPVSHSKNNLPAEYAFAAVLGFSGFCTILFLKILKNKIEEQRNYLDGREAIHPKPPVVSANDFRVVTVV